MIYIYSETSSSLLCQEASEVGFCFHHSTELALQGHQPSLSHWVYWLLSLFALPV